MGVPRNLIREDLYSQGGQLVDPNTNTQYVGPYCEVNGVFFKGKKFTGKNVILKALNVRDIVRNFSPNQYLNNKLNVLSK